MTGIQLEVHSEILDSCTELMVAIALLVGRARDLQSEIVTQGRVSALSLRRRSSWSQSYLLEILSLVKFL